MNKKTEEIRKKSDKELAALAIEKREAVRAFRFGIAGSKVRNVKEGGNARREVARILTEINARKAA
jgi:ribosomal protein L29